MCVIISKSIVIQRFFSLDLIQIHIRPTSAVDRTNNFTVFVELNYSAAMDTVIRKAHVVYVTRAKTVSNHSLVS